VVTRSDKSGSTGNFKTYLKQNNPNSSIVAGNEYNTGFVNTVPASGSPALVAAVAATAGRIGYADLSDVTTAVTKVSVKNKYGQFTQPTATAASNYTKASGVLTLQGSNATTVNGGTYTVDFTKSVKDAYQLSFITYLVGNKSLDNTDFKVYAAYVLNKCAPNPSSITATGYTSVGAGLIANAKLQLAKL
jgi:ABC-type phosphate transport system substrate-binding protein